MAMGSAVEQGQIDAIDGLRWAAEFRVMIQ
jgi:hypothetical protein